MILIARPRPIIMGIGQVLRGGSWNDYGKFCWSVERLGLEIRANDSFANYGFRLILRKVIDR
jgi:formylglycine-generating enzyme required for sulfatase activity